MPRPWFQIRLSTIAMLVALVAFGLWVVRESPLMGVMFGVILGPALVARAIVAIWRWSRGGELTRADYNLARGVYLAAIGGLLAVLVVAVLVLRV